MYQSSLFRAEMTTFTRDVDEPSQLIFRVSRRMLGGRLDTDELHCANAGPVERADWQTKNAIEELHRQRHRQRNFFSQRQSHQLWRLLAKHDMQRRDNGECDGEGDCMAPRV